MSWNPETWTILKGTRKRKEFLKDSKVRQFCGQKERLIKCFHCCAFCKIPCKKPHCWTFDFIDKCKGRVEETKAKWGRILNISTRIERERNLKVGKIAS